MLFGMTSRRAVFPAAIVLIPWAALALPPIRAAAGTLSRRIVVGAGVVVGVLAISPLLLNPLGVLNEERFPDPGIVDAMPDGVAFHGDAEGGYLIYAEWPDRHVFIDDRAELYGAEGLIEFSAVRNGRYEAVFDEWGINTALARQDWPLTDVLREDGWIARAEDDYFVVFVRP